MSDSTKVIRELGLKNRRTIASRVAGLYGLDFDSVFDTGTGYRNKVYPFVSSGQKMCLIIYRNEPGILPRIKRANAFADYLSSRGFPARQTLDKRIIKIDTKNSARYAAVYRYLPGKVIPWEAYSHRHLKLLGGSMSRMHLLASDYPYKELPDIESDLQIILRRMHDYFADESVQTAMSAKLGLKMPIESLNTYLSVIKSARKLAGRQALHMDFVRANILFAGSGEALAISGVLDFEKVSAGHKVFDIARTLAFLYVDSKYKSSQQVFKYFLISGYIRSGGGKLDKITFSKSSKKFDILEALIEFFLMHDFYKFLKHNPYEFLNQNEHYGRTVSILAKRGLIIRTS